MIILDSIQSILPIIIMIAVGYVLTRKGWFNTDTSNLFSKLVTSVALPPYMIYNIMSTYTKDKLIEAGPGLIVPFASIAAAYLLAMGISVVFGIKRQRRGAFRSMFALSNTIFVGLPICLALFGEQSTPYVLLYYIANTTIFWTIGVYGIGCDGQQTKTSIFNIDTIKRIFSPPLIAFILAVILVLLDVQLPHFIMDTCRYIGNLTTPMAMLFIGIVIATTGIKGVKIDADIIMLMAGRFIITPIITLLLSYFLPMPDLMRRVFVIMAAMPAMGQTPILCKSYDADYQYAAAAVTLTTIISMIAIPLYMVFMA